ncbi:DUF192 domain-containing protein [Candidatus Saccharibacteria bacterium]|nr:DUF192 domain-containing protein [Candidatus Saccharibacteria bacterium]
MRKAKNYSYLPIVAIAAVILAVIVLALTFGGKEPKPKPVIKQQKTVSNTICGMYRNDVNISINGRVFKTEQAKSSKEFTTGLGGRACIPEDRAMLFAFSRPSQYKFWMKDMKFPIDIIWISSDRKIAGIETNVQPSSYYSKLPYFINDPKHPAQFVIEVKANTSTELNMQLGNTVTL